MKTAKLRALGGSVIVTLPQQLLRLLNLSVSDLVDISLSNQNIIIKPHTRPNYRLADLIAQCDFTGQRSAEEMAWLNDQPRGTEIL